VILRLGLLGQLRQLARRVTYLPLASSAVAQVAMAGSVLGVVLWQGSPLNLADGSVEVALDFSTSPKPVLGQGVLRSSARCASICAPEAIARRGRPLSHQSVPEVLLVSFGVLAVVF